ncbi:MAG: hypothetical protein D6730_14620 [Bacteroidetes bacterium]|nr:MAG: hypothetical protein D6730_14620 [Bacteroidota bacterium]
MTQRKALHISIVPPSAISESEMAQMKSLYLAHHHIAAGACEARIRHGFDQMVLFKDRRTQRIVGFKGIRRSIHRLRGCLRPIMAVYLGQLYVEKAYRNLKPVQKASIRIFLKQKLLRPWYKTLIWADALTYKPYLLMVYNSRRVYPHPEGETPPRYQALMDELGERHYGERYDARTGCVRKDGLLLKPHVAPIVPRLLKNPYIRFYTEKNKGYKQGNGMLVLTDYSWGTMLRVGKKLLKSWWRTQEKKLKQHLGCLPQRAAGAPKKGGQNKGSFLERI